MTIEENLILGGYLAESPDELNNRLETVYEFFPRLSERRRQQARTLSGGERRMLGIGRGLMTSGEIMMLDEPSLGLAPKIIDHIYEVIAGLRTSSPTLLIVEENPTRLQSVADWIYLMDDGEFVWNGSSDELKESSDLLNTYLGA
jgi:branched-chain amino acid transport system ATP-binding protein